ncbi:hypothetical protein [Clostridium sp. SM-530-WT-3G]|uniref:hypothetical protein n=1 Tax=Clostridium sp. SM-530-WT-3G TaxID=2725303 RepID=UPI00145D0FF7|nr:hypothetical protein [Clostridium sp. SM-530-WT-3G]NME83273.1 hypothetical protein [Clostridium sp. SM-530-WT-3G]
MQTLIDTKTTLLNIPKVITETVPELPGEKVSNDINKFINTVQEKASITLNSDRLVGETFFYKRTPIVIKML